MFFSTSAEKHNYTKLGHSPGIQISPVLGNKKIILGFKRAENLKDILVRSRTKYPPMRPQHPSISGTVQLNPCDTNNCRYCERMNTSGVAVSTQTGRTYHIPEGGTCRHNNLVYLLTCDICHKQYVGQTYRQLRDRLREHFYYIGKGDMNQPLGRHFAQQDHNGLDLTVQILCHIPTPPQLKKTETYRLQQEHHWIHQLVTMEPFGLNVMGK